MMKCPYCGNPLDLDDNFCSHCGRANEKAREHIENMQRYQSEFAETKEDVYRTTERYKGTSVRAMVIAVLLILNVIVAIIFGDAYGIVRSIEQDKSEKHYDEYSVIMDEYLEEGEYHAFYAFVEEHRIRTYDSKYERYEQVIQLVSNYVYIYEDLMDLSQCQDLSSKQYQVDNLMDSMELFYKRLNPEEYYYSENVELESYKDVVDDLKWKVEQMLITFCHISPEDVEQFSSYSSAKRAILIEEGLQNEVNQ